MIAAVLTALLPWWPLPHAAADTPARDWALRGALLAGSLACLPVYPWLAVMGLYALWAWRGPSELGLVVSWAAMGGLTWALHALPGWAWPWLGAAVVTAGLFQAAVCVARALQARRWRTRQRGTLGSPVMTALLLALAWPLAPGWAKAALLPGLWLTWSWGALLSLAAVSAWAGSGATFWLGLGSTLGLGAFVAWQVTWGRTRARRWLPREAAWSPFVTRLVGWQAVWWTWMAQPVTGYGPGRTEDVLRRGMALTGRKMTTGHAHCEPLQFCAEYGLWGVLALALLLGQVGPRLDPADPWSQVWLVGGLLSLTHWPLRLPPTGLIWLAATVAVLR